MSTHTTPAAPTSPAAASKATTARATEFALAMTTLVREVLSRLPENQTLAYLEALHETLGLELWSERMALEGIGRSEVDEDHEVGG